MAASLAETVSVGIINSDTDGENEVPQQSFLARYTHDADEFAYTVDGTISNSCTPLYLVYNLKWRSLQLHQPRTEPRQVLTLVA